MRGTTHTLLHKHSRPPPKQCKHVEAAAGDTGKKTTKLVAYPKIQSRAVYELLLCVRWSAVLQILSTYCQLEMCSYVQRLIKMEKTEFGEKNRTDFTGP